MHAFVCALLRVATSIVATSMYLLFSAVSIGAGEELPGPDPFKNATKRLQGLSAFVDTHLQTVKAVNKVAINKIAGAKATSMDISAFSQIGGGNRTIANMMRIKELDSAPNALKLDFLQDHQRKLEEFSKNLRQVQTDIQVLPPADAKRRLDTIIVPTDMQEILMLGADGRALPLPPHLQGSAALQPTALTPYIIGPGSAATVDYPTVAEIAYAWFGFGSSALCTGTLISSKAVLTAAHCFCDLVNARGAKACLAATYKRGQEDVRPDDKRFISVFFHDRGAVAVDEIIINPDYNFPKKDLAIIKLASEITDIMPAPLNITRSPNPGELATVVGFGVHGPVTATGTPQPGAPVQNSQGLKLVATIEVAKCQNAEFSDDICWNYKLRNEDRVLGTTCHGDSGGPAFATIDGALKLVGVTSGGPDDCHVGADQSFDVDVFKNITWITLTAGSNASQAFASNPNAFFSNPATRAYGAPYHLFITRPDHWSGTFAITNSSGSLFVSVNTTPTFASLTLELTAPSAVAPTCTSSVSDAFATCTVASPATGNWTVRVIGASPQESQVVAAVSR
jgi:hypothetical protein